MRTSRIVIFLKKYIYLNFSTEDKKYIIMFYFIKIWDSHIWVLLSCPKFLFCKTMKLFNFCNLIFCNDHNFFLSSTLKKLFNFDNKYIHLNISGILKQCNSQFK